MSMDEYRALVEYGADGDVYQYVQRLHVQRDDLISALRSLRNEATSFLSLARPSTHGFTNMACLRQRIEDADAALSHAEATS